jgi:polyisoprenoid-binding protein YceI
LIIIFDFMKKFHSPIMVITLGCLLITANATPAEDIRYKARPGSKVRIDGSANIHDWSMEGGIVSGTFDLPPGVTLDPAQAAVAGAPDGKVKAKANVSIPVSSISSVETGREGMNEVMQDAMNAKEHPNIEFKLSEMTLKQPHAAGSPLEFDAKGELTVNGVTKTVSVPAKVEMPDKTKLKITGGPVPINMTDYKVKPPVTLGVFITKPDVKITFTWILAAPKPVAEK